MNAYIGPPKRMPLLLRFGTWIAERRTGKPMLAARLLAWYPKAAIGAGVMESLVAHQSGKATARLLKLVRLQVSFLASCPFCIDMNSAGYADFGISDGEIEALQGRRGLNEVEGLSREQRPRCVTLVRLPRRRLRWIPDSLGELSRPSPNERWSSLPARSHR